jgi:hypothetical protein
MDADSGRCPKCKGEMVRGFILDRTHGGIHLSRWNEGTPRSSFWFGTREPEAEGIPIGVFRCSECGFLESYARSEFSAE